MSHAEWIETLRHVGPLCVEQWSYDRDLRCIDQGGPTEKAPPGATATDYLVLTHAGGRLGDFHVNHAPDEVDDDEHAERLRAEARAVAMLAVAVANGEFDQDPAT